MPSTTQQRIALPDKELSHERNLELVVEQMNKIAQNLQERIAALEAQQSK
jgi:hypothetical protein